MAYVAWSVVFGEQPTASKWNILGTNDASFNDGTGVANLAWDVTSVSNPYKFRAYLGTAQSPGTNTKIQLKSENYDTNSNFDSTTNYRYTAPISGFYHFSGALRQLLSNGGQTQVVIYKNGSAAAYGQVIFNSSGGNQSMTSTASTDLQLAANDYIELYAGAASTASAYTEAEATYLCGHLVSRT